jgi:selenide,water dikinase
VSGSLALDALPEELATLAFDPQTSGGLLIAVPAEKSAVLTAAFQSQDLFLELIGRVEEGGGVEVEP